MRISSLGVKNFMHFDGEKNSLESQCKMLILLYKGNEKYFVAKKNLPKTISLQVHEYFFNLALYGTNPLKLEEQKNLSRFSYNFNKMIDHLIVFRQNYFDSKNKLIKLTKDDLDGWALSKLLGKISELLEPQENQYGIRSYEREICYFKKKMDNFLQLDLIANYIIQLKSQSPESKEKWLKLKIEVKKNSYMTVLKLGDDFQEDDELPLREVLKIKRNQYREKLCRAPHDGLNANDTLSPYQVLILQLSTLL